MKRINTFVLGITISIIDYLYRGRHFQRFWVLEEIARAPYFAFLSVLHLRESLGLRGSMAYLFDEGALLHRASMKQNILNTWKVGVVTIIGLIAFLPDTSSLSIIGLMWFIIGYFLALLTISPTK